MKVLIMGRTGTGKDTLREMLEKDYGWKFVKSHATRKKRFPDEDTHIFITHEEADAVPAEDKVAVTHISNGDAVPDEYFTTRKQVDEADAYIIDPIGMNMLIRNMPETTFVIVYLQAASAEQQKAMVVNRAKGSKSEISRFNDRVKSEDKQFSDFEKSVQDKTFGADNCAAVWTFQNDYTSEWLKQTAFELNGIRQYFRNTSKILTDLENVQSLKIKDKDPDKIRFVTTDGDKYLTRDALASLMLSENDLMSSLARVWIRMPESALSRDTGTKSRTDLSLKDYVKDYLQPLYDEGKYLDDEAEAIASALLDDDSFVQTVDAFVKSNTDDLKKA